MLRRIQILLIFALLFFTAQAQTQTKSDCPFNAVNCAYGCGRHIDLNKDGFCDHSIIELIAKKNISAATDSLRLDSIKAAEEPVEKNEPKAKPHNPTVSPANQNHADTTKAHVLPLNEELFETDEDHLTAPEDTISNSKQVYDLVEVSAITFFLYFLTFFLSKRNLIRRVYHRRIWNALLLITFLVSCLFGFWLVIMINYQIAMSTFRTFLYWHVEVGIAMTLISVFHIIWHLSYFKNLFKVQQSASKNR
jgi:hypothetical protein